MPVYLDQFPDFDYVPCLLNDSSFKDTSYRNDIAPSFTCSLNKDTELVVWFDYSDIDKREFKDDHQYTVDFYENGNYVKTLFSTDDIKSLKTFITNTQTNKA